MVDRHGYECPRNAHYRDGNRYRLKCIRNAKSAVKDIYSRAPECAIGEDDYRAAGDHIVDGAPDGLRICIGLQSNSEIGGGGIRFTTKSCWSMVEF